ncbi:ATP-dependent Clp protease ATP-binding subunit ClpA-like CD4B, chloroplastic, partial [Mucuna pruriens]
MEETLQKQSWFMMKQVGLNNHNLPIVGFIFCGPTGVGKSELAKALAAYYFDSEEVMIMIDMREFMERHTVSKLMSEFM